MSEPPSVDPEAVPLRSPRPTLLWVDCVSAFVAGVLLLALSGWLSPLLGLPLWFVVGEGVVNLLYGSFSFSLARREVRPLRLVRRLAALNMAWGAFCAVLAVALLGTVTLYGTIHFLLGAVYVGGLGVLEWRNQTDLATARA
ncbi:MAG: hypothetical protein AAF845_11610 [Bacteroidota bacterium]